MTKYTLLALIAASCATSAPPDACPRCYAIDEVEPYQPPQKVVILCDNADASVTEPDYPPPDAGDEDPFARVF